MGVPGVVTLQLEALHLVATIIFRRARNVFESFPNCEADAIVARVAFRKNAAIGEFDRIGVAEGDECKDEDDY